jgi:hypothetical protein
MLRRGWLDRQHVDRGRRQLTAFERTEQRIGIDERPARHVDEVGSAEHQGQLARADQRRRARGERGVERDGGAVPQQVILWCRTNPRCPDRLRVDLRICGPDRKAEGERTAGDRPADAAEANDAEARPRHGDEWAGGMIVPPASLDAPVEHDDAAKQGQEVRHRTVSDLVDAVLRHVADPDLPSRGGGDVDVVEAGAIQRDDPQAGQPIEVGLGDRPLDQQSDHIVAGPWPGPCVDYDPGPGEQLTNGVDRIGGHIHQDTAPVEIWPRPHSARLVR